MKQFQLLKYFLIIGYIVIYTDEMPFIELLIVGGLLICFFLLIAKILKGEYSLDRFDWLTIVYILIISFSSLRSGVNPKRILYFSFCLFTIEATLKNDIKQSTTGTLRNLSFVLSFFVFLNLFLILIFPHGLWTKWSYQRMDNTELFMIGGNHNQMGATLLVSYLTCYIYYSMTKKLRFLQIAVLLASLVSLLIVDSKTSILGIIAIFGFSFLRSERMRKIVIVLEASCFFLLQYFFVFALSISSNKLVSFFIEDILEKDLTFSGRTEIWFNDLMTFLDSPIYGYGYQTSEWLEVYINAISPHNYVFAVLLRGGILLLSCEIIILIVCIRKTLLSKNKASSLLLFSVWTLLIMSVMEAYSLYLYFYVYVILFLSKYFVSRKYKKKVPVRVKKKKPERINNLKPVGA